MLWSTIKVLNNNIELGPTCLLNKLSKCVLAQNMEQMGLSQIVKTPTTVHGNCIDHVYLTKGETEVDHKIYYPYYTNHEAIVVILKGWKRNITRSRIRKELKRKKAK